MDILRNNPGILSTTCATCLNPDPNSLKAISTISFDVSYVEKLKICLPQYVTEYFDLEQCFLCEKCATHLDGYYGFLLASMENKRRLEEMIVQNMLIKEEAVEEIKEEVDLEEPVAGTMLDCKIEETDELLRVDDAYESDVSDERTNVDEVKRVFPCRLCTKEFLSKLKLNRHKTIHSKSRPFVCECGKRFVRKWSLRNHQNVSKHTAFTVNEEFDGQFACRICGKTFKSGFELTQHRKTHSYSFGCDCGRTFPQKVSLLRHKKACCYRTVMSDENDWIEKKTRSYFCKICGEKFVRHLDLHRHYTTHVQYRPYVCECGMEFAKRKSLLSHHKNTTHGSYKIKAVVKNKDGTETVEIIENVEKKLCCCICGTVCDRIDAFHEHSRTHIKFRMIVCECGEDFVTIAHLTQHQKATSHVKYRIKPGTGTGSADDKALLLNEKLHCEQCDKIFKSRLALQRHITVVHYADKPFSCKICNKKFTNLSGLDYHISSRHEKIPKFSCTICTKGFYQKYKLNEHLKIHDTQNDTKCTICNEEFVDGRCKCCKSFDDIATNKFQLFVCECGKEFLRRYTFLKHREISKHVTYRIKSETEQPVDKTENDATKICCELCGMIFFTPITFQVHMTVHTGEKPFSCEICQKRFVRHETLLLHMRNQHVKYTCDHCGQEFSREYKLNDHIKSHTDPNTIEPQPLIETKKLHCEFCQKTFTTPNGLKYHTESFHEKQISYTCDICGKGYYFKHVLENHIKSHKQERNLLCSECGASFYNKQSLKFHLVTHATNKPYPCSHCDKQFIKKYELRKHMNQNHLNVKPFVCEICNRGFVTAPSLKRHQSTHSDSRPYSCSNCLATFKCPTHIKRHLQSNICTEHGKNTKLRKRKRTKIVPITKSDPD